MKWKLTGEIIKRGTVGKNEEKRNTEFKNQK